MYYNLLGLVLNAKISAEADKTLIIYTREWGKVSAIAPGAKKIKAKLGAATEPLVESEFMFYVKAPFVKPKITGARILNSFPCLMTDWRRFSIAQYCCEICDSLTPFRSQNDKKYDLLLRTWKHIEKADNPRRIFIAFTLRFLKLSGYGFLDYLKTDRLKISFREYNIIKHLSTLSGEDIDKSLNFELDMEINIMRYINNYLKLYLPRPLCSREFWKKMSAYEDSRERKDLVSV